MNKTSKTIDKCQVSKIKDLKSQRLDAAKAGQIERSQEIQAQLREMHLALTH